MRSAKRWASHIHAVVHLSTDPEQLERSIKRIQADAIRSVIHTAAQTPNFPFQAILNRCQKLEAQTAGDDIP